MVRFIQHSCNHAAGGSENVHCITGAFCVRNTARTRQQKHDKNYNDLRRFTGGIFRASRYLATVRRATPSPCSPRSSARSLESRATRSGSSCQVQTRQRWHASPCASTQRTWSEPDSQVSRHSWCSSKATQPVPRAMPYSALNESPTTKIVGLGDAKAIGLNPANKQDTPRALKYRRFNLIPSHV